MAHVLLTGVLANNPDNRAYVESLGLLRGPWLFPFPQSAEVRCQACNGRMLIGPRTQALREVAETHGDTVELLCHYDAVRFELPLDPPRLIGA